MWVVYMCVCKCHSIRMFLVFVFKVVHYGRYDVCHVRQKDKINKFLFYDQRWVIYLKDLVTKFL